MTITTRQFQKPAYTYIREFASLSEFDQWYKGLTGYMELRFNGVDFLERGNIIIESWNNRAELLGLK